MSEQQQPAEQGQPPEEELPSAQPTRFAAGSEGDVEVYQRAELFFAEQDYIGAAQLLELVVASQPQAVGVRLLRARALYHSAQLFGAEDELRVVLDLAPTEAYAHLLLGRTLQRQGRPDIAVPHLKLAAAMSDDPAWTAFAEKALARQAARVAELAEQARESESGSESEARPEARPEAGAPTAEPGPNGIPDLHERQPKGQE